MQRKPPEEATSCLDSHFLRHMPTVPPAVPWLLPVQLLLRVVSSRAVEVRRSVAVHTRLVKLLAGVAAHDHPG